MWGLCPVEIPIGKKSIHNSRPLTQARCVHRQVLVKGMRTRRTIWRRLLVGSIVAILLPYTSTRCLELLDGGCHLHGDAHAAASFQGQRTPTGDQDRAHSHAGHDPRPAADDEQHSPAPTCCQITGKSAFAVSSLLSLAAPAIIAALPDVHASTHRSVVGDRRPARIQRTHGPPVYLRLATLLI